jgi:hypothetical protein
MGWLNNKSLNRTVAEPTANVMEVKPVTERDKIHQILTDGKPHFDSFDARALAQAKTI